MGKTKPKAPNPLHEAAELMSKAVENVASRSDLDVTGDTGELFRNAVRSEREDIEINVSKIPTPGCIRLGFENLRHAQSLLLSATLSGTKAFTIVQSSLNALEAALSELAQLRTIADSYDIRRDTAFPEFVNNPEFEQVFPRAEGTSFLSDWGLPSRMHDFVAAVNDWSRRHAEELIVWDSRLKDAALRMGEGLALVSTDDKVNNVVEQEEVHKKNKPLPVNQRKVLDIIESVEPGKGITGKQISDITDIEHSSLTSRIIPALIAAGYPIRNDRNGCGYYLDY